MLRLHRMELTSLYINDVYLPTCPNLSSLELQALKLHKNNLVYVESGNYSTVKYLSGLSTILSKSNCIDM